MATPCTDDDIVAIQPGDAVCLSDWDVGRSRPKVKRATAGNLTSLRTVLGICETVGDAGLVNILVAGEVAKQAITNLSTAASISRLVVTDFYNANPNLTCKLRHIYELTGKELDNPPKCDAVPEQFVVGTSDEAGNLAIQPRHNSDETGIPKSII